MSLFAMLTPTGNPAKDQFTKIQWNEETDQLEVSFVSYGSTIVKRIEDKVYLDSYYWDYSNTTGKYRNIFLKENKKETRRKIDSGEYELTNLN